MLGARATIPIFRAQQRDTLINIGFILSEMPNRTRALSPKVARAIVELVARPRREAYVPSYAPIGLAAH